MKTKSYNDLREQMNRIYKYYETPNLKASTYSGFVHNEFVAGRIFNRYAHNISRFFGTNRETPAEKKEVEKRTKLPRAIYAGF